jgi:hypothetical protein
MRRFIDALAIVTLLILAAMPAVAQSIVVSNDEWVFADGYVGTSNTTVANDTQFATNSAQWMSGGIHGNALLLLSSTVGLTYNDLGTVISPYYTNNGPTTVVPNLATLLTYQAIYLSGPNLDTTQIGGYAGLNAALIQFVQQYSGNVFILAGTTCHDANLWNPFLNTFGLTLVDACNGLSGVYPASGNTPGGVRPFSVQQPYGIALFAGVNSVYVSNGNNVQSVNPDCGVEIFNDTSGNGLYGAWMPCACDQTGPRRLGNSSVKGSVMPVGARGRKVHSSLPALPPSNEVYDNGPINGDVNAWTINFNYSVTDSFEILASSQISSLSFGAWLYPGDTIQTVEVSIGGGAFGNNLLDQIVPVTQQACVDNACGYAVCNETAPFNPIFVWAVCPFPFGQCSGTYWVTLQNAVVSSPGDPAYWDENYGAGCGGYQGTNPSTCPSSAVDNSLGPIPSEAFTLQ